MLAGLTHIDHAKRFAGIAFRLHFVRRDFMRQCGQSDTSLTSVGWRNRIAGAARHMPLVYSNVKSYFSRGFSLHKMKSFRALFLLAGAAAVCASGQTSTPVFTTGQAARLIIGQRNFTFADYGATNQLIGSPAGVAYANGVLWVTDSNRLGSTPDNNRVLRFSDVPTYPSPTAPPDIPGSTCGVCRGAASLVL